MKYCQKIKPFIQKTVRRVKSFFSVDIRDVLYFGGLFMSWYGLYLWKGQWLAFMVCGPLLMATGYSMRGKQ